MSGELTAWQRVLLAREPGRPHTREYIAGLTTSFVELFGDRVYGDDPAMVCGLGCFGGRTVVFVGQQKEREARETVRVNWGMAHPEGYQKALRLMTLAEKFSFPVVCLVDTPGAFPGDKAEERNQAGAIARNLLAMSRLRTPTVALVIGEGGSGGALGIALADRVLMLENSIYSVISPEGCAAILWKNKADPESREKAAEALRLTAPDLLSLGIIDEIIPEPAGGAHRDPQTTIARVGKTLATTIDSLAALSGEALLFRRREKYRKMGVYNEEQETAENVEE